METRHRKALVGRSARTSSRVLSVLTLATTALLGGCMQWEELPEGATGFLDVSHVEVDGTLGGMPLDDAAVTRSKGFCTPRGWEVDLGFRLRDGSTVSNRIEMVDFFWDGSASTTFERHEGIDVLIARDDPSAEMGLKGKVAQEGALAMEADADVAVVRVQDLGRPGQLRFFYEATFSTGEQVEGQFDMNMPITD